MKKTKILGLATLSLVACFSVGSYLSIEKTVAEDLTPALDIVGHTLSLENNVHIKYAVSAENLTEGDTLKLKINDKEVLDATGTVTKGSETYYTFEYTGLSAKQMTDTVYAVAYVERGETTYESQKDKYSILEYAYNKLGKTESEDITEDEELKTLLNAMLSYGAASQVYFTYKTDTLATDNFSYVRIDNATFEDGFNYVIGKVGTQVRVYANEGYELASERAEYLTEQNGEIWLTVPEEKTIDTISFIDHSEGLRYRMLPDNTYEVSGYYATGTIKDSKIIIPSKYKNLPVTAIGDLAFIENMALTTVIIPDSVVSIGKESFALCGKLKNVVISSNVQSIGEGAFAGCNGLMNIAVSVENQYYQSIDGNLYDKNVKTLIQYASGQEISTFVIPDSVESIVAWAFCYSHNLTNITIPDSVISIREGAFYGCHGLINITIPKKVTNIGADVFGWMDNLTSVYYKGTESEWKKIAMGDDSGYLTWPTRYYYIEKAEDLPTDGGKYWHYDENGEIAIW